MFTGNVRRIATVLTAEDNASGTLDDVEQQGDQASDSMNNAEESALSLGEALGVSAGATVALAGSLAMLTQQHGQTEQTFARLQTVAGATDEQMEKMRSTAMQIGIDLPISMRQAASAMEQLSFSGFEAEESISAVAGVADIAVASSLNMGQAARTTASALRMFGLEAEETHQVTATMAAVFSSSATNIAELSSAIERVGSTAQAAGISIQETAAALGSLADRGIRAQRAGTALDTTLQRIISGSGQAEKALSKLGLATDDLINSQGQLRDLPEVFAILGEEMEGLESDAERLAVATDLAGQRGARALLPLLQNSEDLNQKMGDIFRSEIEESIGALNQLSDEELAGVEEALQMDVDRDTFAADDLVAGLEGMNERGATTEEMTQKLTAALNISDQAAQALATDVADASVSTDQLAESIGGATTASEIAASQMDTTAGMVQFMRSSFDAMTYSVYTGAGPAITWFNEKLAAGINVINNNEQAATALGAGLAGLTGALGLLTLALGAAWIQTSGLAAVQGILANSFIASIASTYAQAGALGVLSGAAGVATGALSALWLALGPISLVVLGITAAFAGLVALWKTDFLGAGEEAGAVLGFFSEKAGQAWNILTQLVGIIFELGRIGAVLTGLALLAPFAALLELPGTIKSIAPKAKQAAMNLPSMIVDGLDSLGPAKYALPIIGPLLAAHDMITNPSRWIDAGRGLVDAFVSGITGRGDLVPDAVSGIVSDAREYLPFSDAKRGPLSNLSGSGAALVQTIAGGVQSEDTTIANALTNVMAATPLGQAAGAVSNAVSDQSSSGQTYDVTITNDITVEGGSGSTESSVEQAAETGTSTALEEFFQRLSRES
ncbi:phage tail tape measure protein [Halobacterium salinarum]|uniref:phage tail tape measure protein n=1 Tax=Halobacterium salinarum TaxID=2242 RepID=UPI00255360EE|nr:phage tail tape measure protein [Halobacterium salinarum]MDL0133525.1 phage tail tape measure protein [Halobacterium salinarum]